MLTLERARALNDTMITQEHLKIHALNVSYAMGAMARHFGEDVEHWEAIGLLHDYDYEKYPDEHLRHTEAPLLAAGVDPDEVRAILSHGYGICTDVEPVTNLEKSLFTVDELTGIIQACARMRPKGITDLEVKSFMKKFKDKKFAAKCDRALVLKGCAMAVRFTAPGKIQQAAASTGGLIHFLKSIKTANTPGIDAAQHQIVSLPHLHLI